MKKIVLCFFCLIAAMVAFTQTDAIKQYVDTYSEIAINEMMRTGVPASITLAQGIVESQAGQSDLVKSSNNHFGIKCKDEWTGDCVYHDDDLKNECFRVYNSAEESFRDHSDFLKNRPYYTSLFNIDPVNYKAWARGLKKSGYAMERDYPQMLIKMIEANGLQQYTLIALERVKNGGNGAYSVSDNDSGNQSTNVMSTVANETTDNSSNKPSHLQNAIDKQLAESGATAPASNGISYPEGVFAINGRKVIYATAGTSLLSLASSYDIPLKSLLAFNELKKEDILDGDQLIFLQRKLAKSEKEYHITAHSETMEDIAQEEGVRLENLLQYNNIPKSIRPAAGKKIYLRPVVATQLKSAKSSRPTKKKKHTVHNA